MNPLYQQMNNRQPAPLNNHANNFQDNNNVITKFFEFARNIKDNPEQMVKDLIASGQMSQEQFNNLQRMASEFQRLFNIK